jgi:hypothetical protein
VTPTRPAPDAGREIWPNDRVASSDLEPHRWNEGPGGLWGHCGRRSCPTYDTGRLAPVGLVPELALGALRAVESELGRPVMCQVGRKTGSSHPVTRPARPRRSRDRATCSALTLLILGRRLRRASDRRRAQGTRRRNKQSNRQVHFVPAPHSPESVGGLFLYSAWLRSRNLRKLPHD